MIAQLRLTPGIDQLCQDACYELKPLGHTVRFPLQLSFKLACIPTAQARPKFTRQGFAYKPAFQKANERTLEAMLLPYVPLKPLIGAICLKFNAIFPVPKSASKKTRAKMIAQEILHTSKPDLDNLAKQLKDTMTRMRFWQDDRQISELHCRKIYGEMPGWFVRVIPLEGDC